MLRKVAPVLRKTSYKFPGLQLISRSGHGVTVYWKSMRQICEENKSHMNYLPVPEGCWQEAYNKQQARWNILLGTSAACLIVTFGIMWKCGVLYLHRAPPMYNCKKPKS